MTLRLVRDERPFDWQDDELYDGPDCWEGLGPAIGVIIGVGIGFVLCLALLAAFVMAV
jgi:hypothetical protein